MIEGTYEVYDKDKLISSGKNSITKVGRRLIGEMLTSGKFISNILISSENNSGTDTVTFSKNFQVLGVTNTYSTVDSVLNKLTVVYESYGGSPSISTINSIGLSTMNGDVETMVTISNQDSVNIASLVNVYVTYKLTIDL